MKAHQRLLGGVVAIAASLTAPLAAHAQSDSVTALDVRKLAADLRSDINGLGCNASLQDYINALQATITASGDDPATVQAAVNLVSGTPGICTAAKPALNDVDQTVLAALQTTYYATANGPGPGIPIGPPSSDGGGGGSDYRH